MSKWALQVCKPWSIVIAIYDESTPYTQLELEEEIPPAWTEDLEAWEEYIDKTNRRIRVGLLIPNGVVEGIAWEGFLPADTHVEIIEAQELDNDTNGPRVLAQDIIDIFEVIRTQGNNFQPKVLSFVLDNSGSIEVSNYLSQLNLAIATLEETYPDLIVYDYVSNADERWLRDIQVAQEEVCC